MEYKLRKAEPRDVSEILRLVKVGGGPEKCAGEKKHFNRCVSNKTVRLS